jgi:hypothetical protein
MPNINFRLGVVRLLTQRPRMVCANPCQGRQRRTLEHHLWAAIPGSTSEATAKSCELRYRGARMPPIPSRLRLAKKVPERICGNRAAAHGRPSTFLVDDAVLILASSAFSGWGGIISPSLAGPGSRGSVLQRRLFGIVFGTEQFLRYSKTRGLHRPQMGHVIRVQPPQAQNAANRVSHGRTKRPKPNQLEIARHLIGSGKQAVARP